MQKNILAEKGFIHIMGPSPAIVPGEKHAWDGWILESCDILKDGDTYYWYYHARGDKKLYPKGYRIGVATAPTPLGPWTRYEGNPILDYGPEGSWEEYVVACNCVMKEGAYNLRPEKDTYYMWYSGCRRPTESKRAGGPSRWDIGLAVANSPVGPWKRYEGNPVIEDFGYLAGVVRVNGKFYMYAQCPVDITDQGPFCGPLPIGPKDPGPSMTGIQFLLPATGVPGTTVATPRQGYGTTTECFTASTVAPRPPSWRASAMPTASMDTILPSIVATRLFL